MYSYHFGTIDLSTGKAENIHVLRLPSPLSQRNLMRYCELHGNCVLLQKTEEPRKYSLPVGLFVQACEDYAKSAAEQKEPEDIIE